VYLTANILAENACQEYAVFHLFVSSVPVRTYPRGSLLKISLVTILLLVLWVLVNLPAFTELTSIPANASRSQWFAAAQYPLASIAAFTVTALQFGFKLRELMWHDITLLSSAQLPLLEQVEQEPPDGKREDEPSLFVDEAYVLAHVTQVVLVHQMLRDHWFVMQAEDVPRFSFDWVRGWALSPDDWAKLSPEHVHAEFMEFVYGMHERKIIKDKQLVDITKRADAILRPSGDGDTFMCIFPKIETPWLNLFDLVMQPAKTFGTESEIKFALALRELRKWSTIFLVIVILFSIVWYTTNRIF
jgi:hypothetical protein